MARGTRLQVDDSLIIIVDGCILSFSLRYGLRLIRPSLKNESGFSTIVLATSSKIRCAIPIKGKHQYKPLVADTIDNASNEELKDQAVKEESLPATSSSSNVSYNGLPQSGVDIIT